MLHHHRQLFIHPRFRAGWALIAVATVNAVFWTAVRCAYDRRLDRVQLVVDYEEVRALADAYRVPRRELLWRLKQRGITSVALYGQTLATLRDNGRVTILSRATAQRLYPQVAWTRYSSAYSQVLLVPPNDHDLRRQVLQSLRLQTLPAWPALPVVLRSAVADPQPTSGIVLAQSRLLLADAFAGFDPAQVHDVTASGLHIVARPANPPNLDYRRLCALLDAVRATGARVLIFSGEEALGYDSLIRQVAREMQRRQLLLCSMEFSLQRGLDDLAARSGGHLVRGHTVSLDEAGQAGPAIIVDRYVRACRERGIRLLYIHLLPQLKGTGGAGPPRTGLEQNLDLVEAVTHQLRSASWLPLWPRFRTGEASAFGNYPLDWLSVHGSRHARLLGRVAVFLSGLGVLGAAALLLNLLGDLSRRAQILWLAAGVVALALTALSHAGPGLLAFATACLFPIIGMLWGGLPLLWPCAGCVPDESSHGPGTTPGIAMHTGCSVLLKTSLLTLPGGLMIMSLLNDWRYVAKIEDFSGTKAAQLVPLLLLSVLLGAEVFPHRVLAEGAAAPRRRMWQQIQRVLATCLTSRHVIAAAVLAGILTLWMSRSGNDSVIRVSTTEWHLRAALERLFVARPRTKEIVLGHPALIWAVWFAWQARAKRQSWQTARWFVLGCAGLAAIGQVDLINSFCQVNNPVAFVLARSVTAVLLGAAVGTVTLRILVATVLRHPAVARRHGTATMRHPLTEVGRGAALRRSGVYGGLAVLAVCAGAWWQQQSARRAASAAVAPPAALATWPWHHAARESLHRGVAHWLDRSSPDGTTVELFDFDFAVNPNLRLELYDQDEDDPRPFDNEVAYWPRGAGQVTQRLNASGRGPVLAAWNGLFFGLKNLKPRTADRAFHVAPLVLRGQVHYANVTVNRRWTFGWRTVRGRPAFKVLHLPGRPTLGRAFDFAAGSAQCLLKNGRPLHLGAPDAAGQDADGVVAAADGTPSPLGEAGGIPVLDQIRTSRVSLGWTRDSRHLYLLFVKEPDSETLSRHALARHETGSGGWTLADVQRFWLALQQEHAIWDAINSDAGDVAQLIYRRPETRSTDMHPVATRYVLVPPRFALEGTSDAADPRAGTRRLLLAPDFHNAPPGGTIMYFYVRDATPQSSTLQRSALHSRVAQVRVHLTGADHS